MAKGYKNYFEGWYMKHTVGENVFAFIISYHEVEGKEPYGCIQFINNDSSYMKEVHMDSCKWDTRAFEIIIEDSCFSIKGIKANIDFDDVRVRCNIKYGKKTPLDSHIMGPFQYLPKMECNHDVLSLSHDIDGFLEVDGIYTPIRQGVGYMEKDQGCSFPSKYGWTQTNFHAQSTGSIMMAAASIPYGGIKFMGTICTILYRGKQYRLATYNGARVRGLTEDKICVRNKEMLLIAEVVNKKPAKLAAPIKGDMATHIYESVKSEIRYRFYIKGKKVFDFISESASSEYAEL